MRLCISPSFTKLIFLTGVSYTSPNGNENITGFLNKINGRKWGESVKDE